MKSFSLYHQRVQRVLLRKPVAVAMLGSLFVVLSLLGACSGGSSSGSSGGSSTGAPGAGKPGMREAVPVVVGTVVRKTIPVQLRAIGNVQAYSTVSVKAQVGGELTGVHFKEGQDVRKGDLLFTIDRRPFEAALEQAEATLAKDMAQEKQARENLARDVAQAKLADVEVRRYEDLVEKGIVAREQYDRTRTNADALQAAVRADQAAIENAQASIRADKAAIENAKIRLDYCTIRAQTDGRTGSLIVHQGNIVKADDTTPLVVIHRITPIYVDFALPEQNLMDVKKYMASGRLKVEAVPTGNETQPAQGELTFVDNAVDRATGTIRLRATFQNKDRALWPGQFANVVLTLTMQPNAIVAPLQAIQTGQDGQYVFVVKRDRTVESRPVVVDKTLETEAVVQKGLQPGETVVTDGQLRLVPGAKVEIKNPTPTTMLKEDAQ